MPGVGDRQGLPAQLTSFVGRVAETRDVDDALDGGRLVTLTGAGGCGKTRLAVHVAEGRDDPHPDGRWFADLAAIDDDAGVVRTVAECAGAKAATVPAIVDAIQERAVLLVLDNCEHVIDACAAIADALLRACPVLTIVATSREPLGVGGEITFRVPPLRPEDAVALFVERARRARPRETDVEHDAVDAICARLEGIPLAIELAAARMRVLSASQIRDGLKDRFRLLTGGARTAVPRQQTLLASVDWSYDLLQDAERVVLRRLAVFAGGFTLDAAEHVASGVAIEARHVLDLLSQLVDKSLVSSEEDDRFRLLETVRQYAIMRLVDAGEADDVRRRHFDHYLAFAWRRRDAGESDEDYRTRVRSEIENIRRALQWAADRDEPEPIVELTRAMYLYWSQGGNLAEGADWTAIAVDRTRDAALEQRAAIIRRYSYLRALSGAWEAALPAAEEAIELARQIGDQRGLVMALIQADSIARNLPAGAFAGFTDEALELATEIGFDRGRSFALYMKAFPMWRDDPDPDRAWPLACAAIEVAKACGHDEVVRLATGLLAQIRLSRGEVATFVAAADAAAEPLRDVGEAFIFVQLLSTSAFYKALMGDDRGADAALHELDELAAASASSTESITANTARVLVAYARGDWAAAQLAAAPAAMSPYQRALWVGLNALIECRTGTLDVAETHAGEAAAFDRRTGIGGATSFPAGVVAYVRGDLVEAEQRLCKSLATMTENASPAWPRLHCVLVLAAIASRRGRLEEAARVFGGAHAVALALGMSTTTGSWLAHEDGQVDATRAALGAERFAELWAEGELLDWDGLAAYVLRGRGARKRPASGWDSLTPTEVQVVRLVTDGLSNKDIAARLLISVPTVKSHLTHVFAKLGMTSRAELSGAYARRQQNSDQRTM